jgi:hypothetical protein
MLTGDETESAAKLKRLAAGESSLELDRSLVLYFYLTVQNDRRVAHRSFLSE